MKKLILIPALALTVIGSGVAGSLLNTSASASSTEATNKVEISDAKEQQLLEKEAKLTKDESIAIALKEIDGKVKETELEDEDGIIVYGVEVVDAKGQSHDVKIDAKTGKVLKVEVDSDNDNKADDENDNDDNENENDSDSE